MRERYHEVWGIDVAKKRIERVKKKIGQDDTIRLAAADINERLDFSDGYFDWVTVISVLAHVFDPIAVTGECYRILRPGGTLIVQVPNVASIPNRSRLLPGKLPVTSRASGWDGGHLHYFTRSTLSKLFESVGFTVVKMTAGGAFPRIRRLWASLLCGDILIVGQK